MAKVCPTCAKESDDGDLYCAGDGTTLQSLTPDTHRISVLTGGRYVTTERFRWRSPSAPTPLRITNGP